MHFGFALDLPNIDLLNIDLLDQRYTHLDLLDTDIPSKVFMTSCEISSRRLHDAFARRLQDVLKTSWKTKNCSRRLQDQHMFAGMLMWQKMLLSVGIKETNMDMSFKHVLS